MRSVLFSFILCGCAGHLPPSDVEAPEVTLTIDNSGDPTLEGHTPTGFQGQGGGLFTGDNINPGFPDGEGVQIFVTFPLDDWDPSTAVAAATLRAVPTEVRGTPFEDLGPLVADPVRFDTFDSALWDTEALPIAGCILGTDPTEVLTCDLTEAVNAALDDGMLQLRIRFESPGDGDGATDLLMFYDNDSNATAPGLLTLELSNR